MKRIIFIAASLLINNCLAQDNVSFSTAVNFRDSMGFHYSKLISTDSISKTLYQLASPEFEGRETGHRGQKEAAKFLAESYQRNGLIHFSDPGRSVNPNNYFQKHTISLKANRGRNLSVNGDNFLYGQDFFYLPPKKDTTLFLNKIIFCANRNEDYLKVVASDRYTTKNIMVFDNEDFSEGRKEADVYPAVLFIVTEEEKIDSYFKKGSSHDSQADPFITFFITEKVATKFFEEGAYEKLKSKGRKRSIVREIDCDVSVGMVRNDDILSGENVIAKLQGSLSEADGRINEAIVISCHYDHLGKNDSAIYFGADDNASGTAAVVEIARIFVQAAAEGFRPKRDIVFLNVSGEEKGLLGSSYFVSHPLIPLQNIVANLNIDMIGRTDSIHDSTGVDDYVYIIGADKLSTELHTINEEQNRKYLKLELDYKYNSDDDPNKFYKRSDHYNFAKNGIPVIFYFDGKHADYHLPSDTPDKIDMKLLTKRAQLVFLTAWELANRDKRIIVDKKP